MAESIVYQNRGERRLTAAEFQHLADGPLPKHDRQLWSILLKKEISCLACGKIGSSARERIRNGRHNYRADKKDFLTRSSLKIPANQSPTAQH